MLNDEKKGLKAVVTRAVCIFTNCLLQSSKCVCFG